MGYILSLNITGVFKKRNNDIKKRLEKDACIHVFLKFESAP